MNDQIYQDLKDLHLSGMAQSWMLLQETRKQQEINLQDGLIFMLRKQNRTKDQQTRRHVLLPKRSSAMMLRLKKSLSMPLLEGNKGKVNLQLATCEYIKQGASVLVTGPCRSRQELHCNCPRIKPAWQAIK